MSYLTNIPLNNNLDTLMPSKKKTRARRKRGTKRKGAQRSKKKMSKWNNVRNRLSNITKTANRKTFLNIIENRNTSHYRKIKRDMLSKLKFDIKKKYFLDFNFDAVKILSNPSDSASNSVVYLLRKMNKQYILKVTGMKKELGKLSPPDTEKLIYSIMNVLVDKNITPHVFTLTYSTKKELKLSNINSDFGDELRGIFGQDIKFVYPIITETSDLTKRIITLNDFLRDDMKILSQQLREKILHILLFQIMYTLEVFNNVGLKHNDLHLNNIFVQINSKNIISGNEDKYLNKYILDKEYLIPNIGIDIRIFDFDRSCKIMNGIYPEFGFIQSTYMPELYSLNINSLANPTFDTFKVLGELYSIFTRSYRLNSLSNIIESLFTKEGLNLLYKENYYDYKNNIFYKDLVHKGHRYYLMNLEIPNTLMNSTLKICQKLGSKIETKYVDIDSMEQFQEFSIHNI